MFSFATSSHIIGIKVFEYIFNVDLDKVYCVIKRGGFLGSQKIVHIPGIPIAVTALTKEDEKHVLIGIELKVDAILIPCVRNSAFYNCVKTFVSKYLNMYY